MAQRPPSDSPDNSSGASSDGERYDWLYGQGGAPRRDEGGDDATRMMPTQPRPGTGSSGPSPAPTPAPTPRPAPTPSQPGTTYRSSRRGFRPRFRVRYLLLVLLAYIVFLVAVPVYAWTKVDEVAFEPSGKRPDDQPGTTYLLVGSDSRAGLSKEQRKQYGTGNAVGQRTDTIMLLHTGSGPNLLLSIPRDSLVEVPGHGTTKINAAYAFGGPKLLTKTVEQDTGIKIDEYVEIGLGGFVDVVDAVGGITICPQQAMVDKLANLDVKKGCQEADGTTALAYARSRHTYATGDIQRAQAQREVVSQVGSKAISPWSLLPWRYWNLNMAATGFVTFGKGMNPARAAMFAMAMTHVNGENGLTCSVPISDLAVHWDAERAPQMFKAIINDDTDRIGKNLCSPSGLPSSVTG
ncbi:LCP family protein [Nocardioides acrostichi]|uniref:LCP family protein n=1 Tax=Nocardioides acrostichi TaxID=2784339 RepID=A0A930V158_9ACTN|nr:LCP family protein [Nocardioides acrostichi]MBF4161837.1 LCP family protein [Nocardioides acrostichi]